MSRETYIGSVTNVPERFQSWRWEDEESENRYVYKADSKKHNTGMFVLAKEDHTLGNLIRIQLLRDSTVRFAGYRIPHPLIQECHVRVETMTSKTKPEKVFENCLVDLQQETDSILQQFNVSETVINLN